MSTALQIITTTAEQGQAQQIARELVSLRLAACVQIEGPIESWYRWEGQIESAREWRCVIKTRAALAEQVEAAIRRLHSYQEPEILFVPVSGGSEGYLRWLDAETGAEERA